MVDMFMTSKTDKLMALKGNSNRLKIEYKMKGIKYIIKYYVCIVYLPTFAYYQ